MKSILMNLNIEMVMNMFRKSIYLSNQGLDLTNLNNPPRLRGKCRRSDVPAAECMADVKVTHIMYGSTVSALCRGFSAAMEQSLGKWWCSFGEYTLW